MAALYVNVALRGLLACTGGSTVRDHVQLRAPALHPPRKVDAVICCWPSSHVLVASLYETVLGSTRDC